MPYENLNFRYSWRPYQERVLDAIDHHLTDDRLHVVAAPGAGKTTLGLEIFRRLGKTALVLSPTRIIRDQWVDRLSDFIDEENVFNLSWISTNINEPKTLTSVTYQALHAQLGGNLAGIEDEEETLTLLDDEVTNEKIDELTFRLKAHNIKVIILDEAHHLRAEWWRALDEVCKQIPDIMLVSLTATPPYDSQNHEWSRYEALCGPIDEEISIPELVKAGTLCPHQDYIWTVDASIKEKEKIKEYDNRVFTLCNTLSEKEEFNNIVLSHPWLFESFESQAVLKEPEIAVALLAFIKYKQHNIPEKILHTLDLTVDDIPELNRHWWQVLVESALFSKTYQHTESHKDFIEHLKKQLRASELLFKNDLSLERSGHIGRSLALSVSKVDACITINELEYKVRGDKLCQVILTDYIRDEALVSGDNTGEINLGAWPIFNALASSSKSPKELGLLTGRLCMISTSLLEPLLEIVDKDKVGIQYINPENEYVKVTGPLNQLTMAFTSLLINGFLKTLVGTRSLLGEGWDAPSINSLVLASSIGSFMLTNQMRGRAIRIDKNDPDKTSSIWHLVAVDMESQSGTTDYYSLQSRFDLFVGLSEKSLSIESGFERMKLPMYLSKYFNDGNTLKSLNKKTLKHYDELGSLKQRWKESLTIESSAKIIPSVVTTSLKGIRSYHLINTLKYLLIQFLFGIIAVINLTQFSLASKPISLSNIGVLMGGGLVIAMLFQLPSTIAALSVLFKHLPVDGSMKQIGRALTEALCQSGLIETSIRRIKVIVVDNYDGTFTIALAGSTFYESSLFANCLSEILAPIENPRYLVIREGSFLGMKRDDYHAVPLRLSAKKIQLRFSINHGVNTLDLLSLSIPVQMKEETV